MEVRLLASPVLIILELRCECPSVAVRDHVEIEESNEELFGDPTPDCLSAALRRR
jgi:hypothetical protein